MAAGPTKLTNLLDPQVIGAYLDVKLIDKIKLSPIAEINRELEGRPGSTLTFPKWGYIGDAADLAEGAALTYENRAEDTVEIKVKKVAKVVSITDEAVLSGYGNPVDQIGQQLLTAVAAKIEVDLYDAVKNEKVATRNEAGCLKHQYAGAAFAKGHIFWIFCLAFSFTQLKTWRRCIIFYFVLDCSF